MLIIICLLWILFEIYCIINNYLKEFPITTNVVLLLGFLGVLYLICGKDDVLVKKDKKKKEND